MSSAAKSRNIRISDADGLLEVQLNYRRSGSTVLRIGHSGTVTMGVPYGTPDAAIREILMVRAGWIRASIARALALRGRLDPIGSGTGMPDIVEFLGGSAQVVTLKSGRNSCRLLGGVLEVSVKDPADAGKVRKQIETWYKAAALELAEECMAAYWPKFAAMGYRMPVIKVRAMRTRWGSYHKHTNSISINLALIKAPREHMEYVMAHELAHLMHLDHSSGFRNALSDLMPDWKARRSKLRVWATSDQNGQMCLFVQD